MPPVTSQLRAVQAFGAVARAGSVVAAARQLAVSPSAVSHLIGQLERRVGAARHRIAHQHRLDIRGALVDSAAQPLPGDARRY